jgi:lipopolysaccharide export system protein LptA
VIRTREGFVNQQTGQAEFGLRPEIVDGKTSIRADRVTSDDKSNTMIAEGNAIVVDTAQGTTIVAGIIFRNTKTDAVLATRKPLMIVKQDNDSIYIKADTLFSARLTDLYGQKDSVIVDTIKGTKVAAIDNKDSTNRYFEAFRNVKVYNDSLQAAADSMFYSFKDSVFRLYDDPVVWAQNSQITGDTILLFTKNKKAERVEAFENGFMVNKLDTQAYNQIKSTRMMKTAPIRASTNRNPTSSISISAIKNYRRSCFEPLSPAHSGPYARKAPRKCDCQTSGGLKKGGRSRSMKCMSN